MTCKICSSRINLFQRAIILNKYNVDYFKCDHCGFVQTEKPYWIDEAYKNSINISDTGIITRNIYLSKQTAAIIYFFFDKNAIFLDFAGGYGILTRLMRDIGFDFYWHDLYSKNLFARGFEYAESIKDIELITAFECIEHFVEPMSEIEKMIKTTRNILFTTELIPASNPKPEEWWYYGLDHGQHVCFYTKKSLEYIAQKFKLQLLSYGSIHLLTNKYINQNYFTLLIKFAKYISPVIVSRNMKSKIHSDMELIRSRK